MTLPARVSDLRPYELLATVAETGSISRAARRHHLAQATVSLRMRALEQALRVAVLDRSPRGATLTPAGVAVLDHARPLLHAAAALEEHLAAASSAPPVLHLAASSTIAEHLLPIWLTALRRRHPTLRIELRSTNSAAVSDAVLAGTVDLGFVEDEQPPPATHAHVVGTDELLVLVTAEHPWARRSSIDATDLNATELLTREHGSGTRAVLERRLADLGLTAPSETGGPATELTTSTLIRNAAAQGLGVAVLSSLTVGADFVDQRLQPVVVDDLDLRRALHAIHRPGHPLQPAARELLEIASLDWRQRR